MVSVGYCCTHYQFAPRELYCSVDSTQCVIPKGAIFYRHLNDFVCSKHFNEANKVVVCSDEKLVIFEIFSLNLNKFKIFLKFPGLILKHHFATARIMIAWRMKSWLPVRSARRDHMKFAQNFWKKCKSILFVIIAVWSITLRKIEKWTLAAYRKLAAPSPSSSIWVKFWLTWKVTSWEFVWLARSMKQQRPDLGTRRRWRTLIVASRLAFWWCSWLSQINLMFACLEFICKCLVQIVVISPMIAQFTRASCWLFARISRIVVRFLFNR